MATTKFVHVDPATGKIWNRPALYDALQAAKAEALTLRKELAAVDGQEEVLLPWSRYQRDMTARWNTHRREWRAAVEDVRRAGQWTRRQVDGLLN